MRNYELPNELPAELKRYLEQDEEDLRILEEIKELAKVGVPWAIEAINKFEELDQFEPSEIEIRRVREDTEIRERHHGEKDSGVAQD